MIRNIDLIYISLKRGSPISTQVHLDVESHCRNKALDNLILQGNHMEGLRVRLERLCTYTMYIFNISVTYTMDI